MIPSLLIALAVLGVEPPADPASADKPATPEQQLIDRLHALNLAEARK